MITVRLEWPDSKNAKDRYIGLATIVGPPNLNGSKTASYEFVIFESHSENVEWLRGQVSNFPRTELGPWDLLFRCLSETIGHRNVDQDAPVTLESARAKFWSNVDDGTTCPCCDRDAKRYKRKLNAGMVRALIVLYRITRADNPPDGWINLTVHGLPDLPLRPPSLRLLLHHWEYTKLAFWNLIEERPKEDTNSESDGHKGSGVWRLTDLGKAFAHNRVSVPRHIYVYDNHPQTCEVSEMTDIATAWEDRFDFDELMSAAGDPPSPPPRKKRGKNEQE